MLFTPPSLPATDTAASLSSPARTSPTAHRPAKRARSETTGHPDPGDIATAATPVSDSGGGVSKKRQAHHQRHQEPEINEEANTGAQVPTVSARGAGASATLFARVAATEAVAQLAGAAAATAAHEEMSDDETATAAAAAPAPVVKTRSRKHQGSSSSSISSGQQPPPPTAGRHGGGGGGGAVSVDQADVVDATARELVMSAVASRARSVLAWERELAFLLMEACCDGGGRGGGGGGGGGRGEGGGSGSTRLSTR